MLLFQMHQALYGSDFATWDAASLVSPLSLTAANTQVDAISVASPKTCRATFSTAVFPLPNFGTLRLPTAEIFVWGDLPIVAGAGAVPDIRVGFVNAAANLSAALGADNNGIGLQLHAPTGGGVVIKNGAPVTPTFSANTGLFTTSVAIQLELTIGSGGISSLKFQTPDSSGNITISSADLPPGPLFLAVSVQTDNSQPQPNIVHAMLNAGQRKFERNVYNPPVFGFPQSTWIAPRTSTIGPFYFGDVSYLSGQTETPPNTLFKGRMIPGSTLQVPMQLRFWPWGGDGVSLVDISTNVSVANADRAFDPLVMGDSRDIAVFTLLAANGILLDSLTLNSAKPVDDVTVQLNLAGPAASFEMPAQYRIGLPNSASSLANKPYPIGLGAFRNATPILRSGKEFVVSDEMYSGVSLVRDKAYPLNPSTDYTQSDTGGIVLTNSPQGALTVDVQSFNCALATNGGVATASSTRAGNFGPGNAINGNRNANSDSTGAWNDNDPGAFPDWLQVTFSSSHLVSKVVVYSLPDDYITVTTEPSDTKTFSLFGVTSFEIQTEAWDGLAFSWITVATVTGNNLVKRTVDFAPVIARSVRVVVNATADGRSRIVEVEAWTTQRGRTLDSLGIEVFRRSPVSGSWPTAEAQAIDAAAGYKGPIGFFTNQSVKARDILAPALDSFCACLWQSSVQHVTRLIDPDTVPIGIRSGVISELDMLSVLLPDPDLAPGLTTQAMGQRNWTPQTDFTTDVITLTPEVRSKLQATYRITKSYAGKLAGMYEHARYASPIGTLLDDPDDLQRFIDYVCGLYKVPRMFSSFTMRYIATLAPGQVWTLSYPFYGLSAGVAALVVGVTPDRINQTMQVKFWHAGIPT